MKNRQNIYLRIKPESILGRDNRMRDEESYKI